VRVLPMFPLGTVLFPYAVLPLHVFEPRYRVMTRRCVEGDGEFGVVLIERGSEVGGGDTRFGVGTVARIVQAAETPDGRYALVTTGLGRFRVTAWMPDDPFPQAEVELLNEPPAAAADGAVRDEALDALRTVVDLWRALDARVPDEVPPISDDPARAAFELCALAPVGPLDAQRLLEAPSPGERLSRLVGLLRDHADELRARIALGDGT
jgi:Lon protease-like protein